MYATLKLLNSYFWKTIYGPILAFVFPVILLAIMGNILRLEYVYPGIIALAMLFLGIIALPLAIMELKGSSLFKYIGSSPVNPMKFTLVAIGFYAFVAICTGFTIFFATMAIFPTRTFPAGGITHGVLSGIFTLKGSFSFYLGCLIHLILVIVCGLVISTFAKTPQQALTFGLIITIPSMFLSGMILSVDVIGESEVMNWISRMIPFRYSTGNIIVAATPKDQLGSAIDYWLTVPFYKDGGKTIGTIISTNSTDTPNNMLDSLIWPYKSMTDQQVVKYLTTNSDSMFGGRFPNEAAVVEFVKNLPGVLYQPNMISNFMKDHNSLFANQGDVVDFIKWFSSSRTNADVMSYFSNKINSAEATNLINYSLTKIHFGSNFVTGYEAWDASNLPIDIFNNAQKKGDWTLFNLLSQKWDIMQISSDNNIFNWAENWGVRKIPSVDTLTNFVTKFFQGVDENGNAMSGKDIAGRVSTIASGISKGDFRWLEVFTHQSNVLYYQADRVLNVLLPLALTGLGSWYVFKNFTWSLR